MSVRSAQLGMLSVVGIAREYQSVIMLHKLLISSMILESIILLEVQDLDPAGFVGLQN